MRVPRIRRAVDPLDAVRRPPDASAAQHLAGAAPYRHVRDETLVFDPRPTIDVVAIDRVWAGADGSTVHVITPTDYYGRGMENRVEDVAEIVRAKDPNLGGLILYWPSGTWINKPYFVVMLFGEVAARGTTVTYHDPKFARARPADVAQVMQVPEEEIALLMSQIHHLAARVPQWWQACEAADKNL